MEYLSQYCALLMHPFKYETSSNRTAREFCADDVYVWGYELPALCAHVYDKYVGRSTKTAREEEQIKLNINKKKNKQKS